MAFPPIKMPSTYLELMHIADEMKILCRRHGVSHHQTSADVFKSWRHISQSRSSANAARFRVPRENRGVLRCRKWRPRRSINASGMRSQFLTIDARDE